MIPLRFLPIPHGIGRRTRWASILAAGSAVVILVAVLTLSPALTRVSNRALGYSSIPGKINEYLNPFRTRHALLQGGLPVYDLRIAPAEYREILKIVDAAKARGRLDDDLKQWANARFLYEGRSRDVRLRVRGDFADHWENERRSWRIRFPKEDPLDGRREINLIVPADGKAITQAFANAVFRRLGCMTLRDRYSVLRINGVPQGVYYECEHFGAPFAAYNNRPETTVFTNPGGGRSPGSYREMVTENHAAAWAALDALLAYERDPSPERFTAAQALTDMDDYLRYLAGIALFCADHTSEVTDNHRLYYDTAAGAFLRIPWDLEPQRIPRLEQFDLADWHATFDVFARWPMSAFQAAALRDDRLRLQRNRHLWELVRDDSLMAVFDEVYKDARFGFWADIMGKGDEEARLDRFRDLVHHNIRAIRRSLAMNRGSLTVRTQRATESRLEFTVDHAAGFTIRSIDFAEGPVRDVAVYRDSNGNGRWDSDDALVADFQQSDDDPVRVAGLNETLSPEYRELHRYPAYIYDPAGGGTPYRAKTLQTVLYPAARTYVYFLVRPGAAEDDPWPAIQVDAVNAVTRKPFSSAEMSVRYLPAIAEFDSSLRLRPLAEFLEEHSTFRMDEDSPNTIALGPGIVPVDGTIVVPAGGTLRIAAGTRLELGPRASLVSFSPMIAEGTPDAPIEFAASSAEPWGVVGVVRPGSESRFRHVRVSGGNTSDGLTVQGVYFAAALAVHYGDAVVEHCEFQDNPAEDGLNVKHGRAIVRHSRFERNGGDAIDFDWVHGEIVDCQFLDNANDAVDISGSQVTIARNRIAGSGDKGISVGERSRPVIRDNFVLDNTTGIAVKDLSDAEVERCTLAGNRIAVAAYCKKPIFGGGRALVRDCQLIDNGQLREIDARGSVVFEKCRATGESLPSGVRPLSAKELSKFRRTIHVDSPDGRTARSDSGTD